MWGGTCHSKNYKNFTNLWCFLFQFGGVGALLGGGVRLDQGTPNYGRRDTSGPRRHSVNNKKMINYEKFIDLVVQRNMSRNIFIT